jgi:hypothetical protein
MPRLTNNTRETIDFIVKGAPKDGVPPTESIAPGETRDIEAVDNATYKGRIAAGAITVGATRGAAPVAKDSGKDS